MLNLDNMEARRAQIRFASKLPWRNWRFGPNDLAKATGKTRGTLRQDRFRGVYDPTDLLSLSRYVVESHDRYVEREARRLAKKKKRKS